MLDDDLYERQLKRIDAHFEGAEYIPIRAVAAFLGPDVRTIQAQRALPKKKIGARWYVPRAGLARYMAQI